MPNERPSLSPFTADRSYPREALYIKGISTPKPLYCCRTAAKPEISDTVRPKTRSKVPTICSSSKIESVTLRHIPHNTECGGALNGGPTKRLRLEPKPFN